jgi:hypothetical protein
MMAAKLPVVFLTYANDMDNHSVTLKDEIQTINNVLEPLELTNTFDVYRKETINSDELYDDLLEIDGRVVVFHYAGHANDITLQLDNGNGAAGGIAKLLGQQTSLKLVFLSGCATAAHVKLLHDAGVPAVVATTVKVSNSKATQFSTAFYSALVKGHSVFKAFESARIHMEAEFDTDTDTDTDTDIDTTINFNVNRHPNFHHAQHKQEDSQMNIQNFEFEWTLFVQEDCVADLEQWRLTHAQKEWLMTLQDSKGTVRDLEDNPIYIEHRTRVRTIYVIVCLHCHTTTSYNDERHLQSPSCPLCPSCPSCPLCASSNVKKEQVQSNIPEFTLPFDIDEQQAQKIALAAAGLSEVNKTQLDKISLRKVYIPFWVFDTATRSHLRAQRGVTQNSQDEILTLTWQDIVEDIDLGFESFKVPGFTEQAMASKGQVDWHWSLEEKNKVGQPHSSVPFIPFEVSPQTGFNTLLKSLSKALAAEVSAKVDSQQQKNIVLNTRYKHLSISSVFLPHWCAVVIHEQQTSSIIINGQTGVLRFSPSSDEPALTNLKHTLMNHNHPLMNAATDQFSSWASVLIGTGIGFIIGLIMCLLIS